VDVSLLARELVEIDSPTGREGPAVEHVALLLTRLGYAVQRQEVSPGRSNLYALREPPVAVFSTHLDTVTPSLPVREDAEYLYGRGTADAKGIAAVQIAACERLAAAGERRVGLLFVVGEEGLSDGARAAATLAPRGRFVVNGEPTENRLAVGTKGSLRITLRAAGTAAHSAYPEEGSSAIAAMLDALERIRRIPLPHDPVLGETTLNIGTIAGGTVPNVIPDTCTAELHVRTVSEGGQVADAIRAACDDRVDVDVGLALPPVRLRALPGFETTVVRYATDLPFLEGWGERFLLGPGSIRVAHTAHERVAKRELVDAVGLYERLTRALLAGD
jgi:acetylornithine deacetylase